MPTVAIIDDHALFRDGLAMVLAGKGLTVSGSFGSIDEAFGSLAAAPPDVLLLDLDLGRERGEDLLWRVQPKLPYTRVLVITAQVEPAGAWELLRRGASGVVLKHNPAEVVIQAIEAVLRGEQFVDLLIPRLTEGEELETEGFTDREKSVFQAMYEGQSNKEIASALGISEAGVKAALQRLFNKTGVRTRGQLVRVALEQYPQLLGTPD